jgi:hypothetical protein
MTMMINVRQVVAHGINAVRAFRRHAHYDRMAEGGISPFCCVSDSLTITKAEARAKLGRGHLLVPNVSGFYHGILREYWERHGLGDKCLLVSETSAVADVFSQIYSQTQFVTTDYFLDLQPHPTCDVLWDLCSPIIPETLRQFESVICQATLEHILDPAQVMRNLSAILESSGMLYLQTHTPAFHYHGYPRDYLRYFPDWFHDITTTVGTLELVELLCVDGHAFAAYRKRDSGTDEGGGTR